MKRIFSPPQFYTSKQKLAVKGIRKEVKEKEKNLMVAVAASVEKNLLISVFLRVENVVTEPQAMDQQKAFERGKIDEENEEGTHHSRQNFIVLILATLRRE